LLVCAGQAQAYGWPAEHLGEFTLALRRPKLSWLSAFTLVLVLLLSSGLTIPYAQASEDVVPPVLHDISLSLQTVDVGTQAQTVTARAHKTAFTTITAPQITVTSGNPDIAPPVLHDISLSPQTVDVGTQAQTVTARAHITDDNSGVGSAFLYLDSDTSNQNVYQSLRLESGTLNDGIFSGTFTIPYAATPGSWTARFGFLQDNVKNDAAKTAFTTITAPQITVTSGNPDIAPPVLHDISLSLQTVDVGTQAQTVTARAHITDDNSGVGSAFLYLDSDTSNQNVYQSLRLESGTLNDGIFSGTFTIPYAATPGSWTARFGFLQDNVKNDAAKTAFTTITAPQITVTSEAQDLEVIPAEVTFDDSEGTASDTYSVPSTSGVEYLVDGQPIPAGTYAGAGLVTVAARALAGFVLATGATNQWQFEFSAQDNPIDPSVPPSLVTFERTSPNVIRDGDQILFDWTVQDVPATTVMFYLNDRLGRDLQVRWDGPSAYSGTASYTIDETQIASGDLKLWGITIYTATSSSVHYRSDGSIYKSPTGLQDPTRTTFDFSAGNVRLESNLDLSVPPSLTSFERTSPDVIRDGDQILFDWTVQDVPATTVMFYLNDRLGRDLQVRWDGPSAYSGTASYTIDETQIASGDLKLWGITIYTATSSSVHYRSDGSIYKSPTGLQDPTRTTFDFSTGNVRLESNLDLSVPPSLTSFERTSPDVIRDGDQILFDWTVQDVPATTVMFYLNDRLGRDLQVRWDGPSAYSGTASYTIDETQIASGDLKLWGITIYTATSSSVHYRSDGSIYKSPTGLQDPTRTTFDFSAGDSHLSPATPYQVTPTPLVSTDQDGTSQDTYTIPATDGVDYQIGGKTVEAGTYAGTGSVTVTAKAKTDYVLAGTTEWTTTFKATPYQATPAPVAFTDTDGTSQDTYTIPATEGVDYQIGGKTVEAGTYPGTGTVTVTAKARTDYVLAGTTEWAATFKATPYQATPAPVVFTDQDGTAEDTYTIPATEGVDYLINNAIVPAGTYPATGTIKVTAKAKTDYVLTGTTEWTATFKATPYQATPAPVVFTDQDGTAEDTYTIPATDGVDYQIGGKTVDAGTYPGTGTVTVMAKAKTDYVLTGTTDWATTFKPPHTRPPPHRSCSPTRTAPAEDSYTIPATDGVDYQIGGKTVEAGTYPATGTLTVTAKAKADYILAGTTDWTATFKATPYQATPAPVVFTDQDGTAEDRYTIPVTDGVDYLINNAVVPAGTYPGTGTITVTAREKTDYVLAGTTEWAATFKATPYQATPAPVVFTDHDGTNQDTYTIPAIEGVDYLINNAIVPAGTYPAPAPSR
jgi:hypothetical protein